MTIVYDAHHAGRFPVDKKFTVSSPKKPCPVCGRTKDGDCRFTSDGRVFCHTYQHYKTGETVRGADGQEWACIGNTTNGAGWGVFKVHEPLEKRERWQKPLRPKSEKFFYYHDRNGNPLVRVKRIDRGDGTKTFSQERWDGKRWQTKLSGLNRSLIPVYRYKEVKEAIDQGKTILWVEGESTAEALWEIGLPATTSIGGSGGFTRYGDYGQDVANASLVICPDRDEKGLAYADQVAQAFGITRWLYAGSADQWDKPSDGYDIGDWITDLRKQGLDSASIQARLMEAIVPRRGTTVVSGIDTQQVKAVQNEVEEVTPEVVEQILADSQTRFDIYQLVPAELADAIACEAKTFAVSAETLLAVFLATASSLIPHKLFFTERYRIPSILWLGLVGESGTGKSPVINSFIDPLVTFQTSACERYELEMEAYKKALEDKENKDKPSLPHCRYYFVQDFTWESIGIALKARNHCLICVDELAGFVLGQNQYKARGGNDRQRWLTAYNGKAINVLRTARNFYTSNASLSILGGIQPSILQRLISADGATVDGFWARFMWVEIPDRRLPCPIDSPSVDITELIAGIYRELDQQAEVSRSFRLCPQGKRLWKQWWDEVEAVRDEELNPFLKAIYPKALERAGRVALTAHCLNSAFRKERPDEVIPPQILKGAIAFVRWTLQQARTVYGDCGHAKNPEAQRIARFVQRFSGKTVTGRRVTEWWTGSKKPSAMQSRQWLADLVALGYAEVINSTPDKPDFTVRIKGTSGTSAQNSLSDCISRVPTSGTFLGTQVHPTEPVAVNLLTEGTSGTSAQNSLSDCISRVPTSGTFLGTQVHPTEPVPKECTFVPVDVPTTGTPETMTGSQFQQNVPNVPEFRDRDRDGEGTAVEECTFVPVDVPTTGTPETMTGSQFQQNVPNVPEFRDQNKDGKVARGLRVGDWVKYKGNDQTLRLQCSHARREGLRIVSLDGESAYIKSPKWVCSYRVPLADLVPEGESTSGRSGRQNGRNRRPPETETASHLRVDLDDGRSFDNLES